MVPAVFPPGTLSLPLLLPLLLCTIQPTSSFLEEVFLEGGDPQRLTLGPGFIKEVIPQGTCEGVRAAGEERKEAKGGCDFG